MNIHKHKINLGKPDEIRQSFADTERNIIYVSDMMRLFAEEVNVHEVIWDVDTIDKKKLQGHFFYDLGYPIRVTNANGYMKFPKDGELYCFVDGIQEEKFGRFLSFFKLLDLLEFNGEIIHDMKIIRRYSSEGLSERKRIGIAVKQSLQSIEIINFGLRFDTTMCPYLLDEGNVRRIIRDVQNTRKELGISIENLVIVALPDWPDEYKEYIKKETMAENIIKGKNLLIIKRIKKT